MGVLRSAVSRLLGIVRRHRLDRDIARELESHVELHVSDGVRAGMSPEHARRHALLTLGGLQPTVEQHRDRRGLRIVDALVQDLRYAVRTFLRSPGFTAVAVLTLALGIGGTTAIFSVIDTTLLRPMAFHDPERLVVIHETLILDGLERRIPVNAFDFREWKTRVPAFEAMSLVRPIALTVTGAGEPELLEAARVSANLFSMLRVRPSLGRSFLEEEDAVGRDRVVIISDSLWRRRFHADSGIIGRTITLDGEPYEVIGVLPPTFTFPRVGSLYAFAMKGGEPDVWKPFAATPAELEAGGMFNFAAMARLTTGTSVVQAQDALAGVQRGIAAQAPGGVRQLGAAVTGLQEQVVGGSRRGLQLLLAAIGSVLLIACVNLTNLMLVRSETRAREVGIRTSVGATRGRLVRQMLVESLTLAGAGGGAGLAIAYGLLRVIVAYAPPDVPRVQEMAINWRLLMFATTLAMGTGVMVGILPAWRFASARRHTMVGAALRVKSTGATAPRLRSSLVAAEVAAAMGCLLLGGLLLNSLVRLLQIDPGFSVQHVFSVDLTLPTSRYPNPSRRVAFLDALIDRLKQMPGVVAAGASNNVPLTGAGSVNRVAVEGSSEPVEERLAVDTRMATPGLFAAMGIPLRAGRVFSDADGDRRLAVVAAATARRLWPNEDAVGKRLLFGPNIPVEVIGVVGNIRTLGLDREPTLTVYVPARLNLGPSVSVSVRTLGDTRTTPANIAQAIRGLDAELAFLPIRTMDEIVGASVAQRRFQLNLMLLFAALATAIASIGIYGVVSHVVLQRTNEFGIRMALGARAAQIRRLVFRQGMPPVVIGLVVGVAAALAGGRFLSAMLFGVSPTDPLTIGGVLALIVGVATLAILMPAQRATHIDPLVALRCE